MLKGPVLFPQYKINDYVWSGKTFTCVGKELGDDEFVLLHSYIIEIWPSLSKFPLPFPFGFV